MRTNRIITAAALVIITVLGAGCTCTDDGEEKVRDTSGEFVGNPDDQPNTDDVDTDDIEQVGPTCRFEVNTWIPGEYNTSILQNELLIELDSASPSGLTAAGPMTEVFILNFTTAHPDCPPINITMHGVAVVQTVGNNDLTQSVVDAGVYGYNSNGSLVTSFESSGEDLQGWGNFTMPFTSMMVEGNQTVSVHYTADTSRANADDALFFGLNVGQVFVEIAGTQANLDTSTIEGYDLRF
ncbi:MAG: hypothetical protein V1716_03080 [Candidatus Uhrbacteria bacterium]